MILFIDDEFGFNQPYVEKLEEAKYLVEFKDDINEAISYYKEHVEDIQLVIIDVMADIPEIIPDSFDEKKAKLGLRTGEEVLKILNKIADCKKCKKIFFTNLNDDSFHNKYRNSKDVNGTYKKRETSLEEILNIVRRTISK